MEIFILCGLVECREPQPDATSAPAGLSSGSCRFLMRLCPPRSRF